MASGHSPASSWMPEMRRKNTPKPRPEPSATSSDSGSGRPIGPLRLTSAMATSAAAMPTTASGPGRSPETRPPITGTTAATTAEMGDTTAMRPVASPR